MDGYLHICFYHDIEKRELLYYSNNDLDWVDNVPNIREFHLRLFDDKSGDLILMLAPMDGGMVIVISRFFLSTYGDNLSVYIYVPYNLYMPSDNLMDFISSITDKIYFYYPGEQYESYGSYGGKTYSELEYPANRYFIDYLDSITRLPFPLIKGASKPFKTGDNLAYRIVDRHAYVDQKPLFDIILDNLFQDYYWKYKCIFLSSKEQYILNTSYDNLTSEPILDRITRNIVLDFNTTDFLYHKDTYANIIEKISHFYKVHHDKTIIKLLYFVVILLIQILFIYFFIIR